MTAQRKMRPEVNFPVCNLGDAINAAIDIATVQKEIEILQEAIDTVQSWHVISEKKLAKHFVASHHRLPKPCEEESVDRYRKRLKQAIKAKIKSKKHYRFYVPKESLESFLSVYLRTTGGVRTDVGKLMRSLLLKHFSEEQLYRLEQNAAASRELT